MATSFYHCTYAALYWIGNKINLGKYPGIDAFARGKGGTATNPNRCSNNAGRTPTAAKTVGGISGGKQV